MRRRTWADLKKPARDGHGASSRWHDGSFQAKIRADYRTHRTRSRRLDHVKLDQATRAYLEEIRFAVLATASADGMPQQSVMWYELDGDVIMMNTARGRVKDRNLLRDARASICVEDGYRYVTITGMIAMDDDQTIAQRDIERLATRYHGTERASEMMRDQFGKQQRVTLRMSIDRVDAHGFDAQ
jgi:PPOX class probable F420-dependent enzyme